MEWFSHQEEMPVRIWGKTFYATWVLDRHLAANYTLDEQLSLKRIVAAVLV